MRIIKITALFCLILTVGCSQEEEIKEVENNLSPKMRISNVGFANLTFTDPYFKEGDKMGLFLNSSSASYSYPYRADSANYNLPSTFIGGAWQTDYDVYLTNVSGYLFAYYPYSSEVNNISYLPIDATKQIDYLYGEHRNKAALNVEQPEANIEMKHICALLRFQIKKSSSYEGEGKLTQLEVGGTRGRFHTKGTYNMQGTVFYDSDSSTSLTFTDPNGIIIIETVYPNTPLEIIVPPINTATTAEGEIFVKVTLDGKEYIWETPKSTRWVAGNVYTFNITIGSADLRMVSVNKAEWKTNTTQEIFIDDKEEL